MRLAGDCVTTVRDVLALELIRAAEPTVVCGEHALDRPVRWVHVGEIPDIARFLAGGEVVLTAGLGIGSTEREQAGYITSLAQAGVAALVIEVAGRAGGRPADHRGDPGVPVRGRHRRAAPAYRQ